MRRLTLFTVLFVLLVSALGLSSAQAPAPADPLFSNNGNVSIPDGKVLIQGDIVVPEEYLHTRGAHQMWRWPGGKVYYDFASYISPENRQLMREAMDELESVADVTFIPRIWEPNYIHIIEAGGNWSQIGMVRGMQELSMYNWDYKYIIIHELMHALGIWHEQSRTDRDAYVTINYGNIYPGYEYNFDIEPGSETYGSYDFCSVMHYGATAFSLDGYSHTIVPKPGYEAQAACMGNRTSMTVGDEETIQYIYSPTHETLGDRPETAIEITAADFTFTAPSSDFGISPDEPAFTCSSDYMPVTNTVWFTITPDNPRYIDIFSGTYDTVIGVYTEGVYGMFLEACSDYYGAGTYEWVGLPLEAGKKYYIGVGSWVGSSGLLNLQIDSYRTVLSDGGFDWESTNWKYVAGPAGRRDDKVKCGRNGAFGSLCALRLKGGVGENSRYTQKHKYNGDWNFEEGDYLWLSAMITSNSAKTNVKVSAVITFEDATKLKLPILTLNGATSFGAYDFYVDGVQVQRADVKKAVVKVVNKSTGGKAFVDNLTLTGSRGVSLRNRPQFGAPTKPQTFAPVANQRGTQSGLLPVPPPAN